ncbi:MAG: S8 family serine peptidase [Planctomycetota bacterium]|nr:S8 family serine peptidase [Planctomycetota bacterium]
MSCNRGHAAALIIAAMFTTAATAGIDFGPPPEAIEPEFVPDELIIGFEDVPAAPRTAAIDARFPEIVGWRGINHAPHPKSDPNGIHPLAKVRVITLAEGSDVLAHCEVLENLPGVRYAHPNYVTYPAFNPNDTLWNQQYGPQIVEAPTAWDTTVGSGAIRIAVADTGINFGHEDFQDGMIWTNPGEIPGNGVDDDGNGYVDDVNGWDCLNDDNNPTDTNGHGSHVSGILAARMNNAKGIAGMAQVTVVPLQVFTPGGTWEAITEAVYYATDNGCSALNYSGGGYGGDGALADAVQYAWDHGMPVIAAAGNYNSSTPFYPAAYTPVIAISGTDRYDNRYSSSNYGNWIDVAAPGVDVLSCGSDYSTQYYELTGTSMSSPHVCGLVGLMYSINPDLTPQQVRDLLRENAEDLGNPGFDIYFGYGRIDAAATIAAIPNDCPGDFDGDGYVNTADLLYLLASWGTGDGDMDNDGDTDTADLLALLAAWGECP